MVEKIVKQQKEKLEKGFLGFWVKRYKVSYLLIFLLVVSGVFALFSIPKETSPDIEFGIISITTTYPGVNPTDMDSLITDKIEKEIKDIEGIKKITSSSSVGLSSMMVELQTGFDSRDALTDIKDKIEKIDLPEDANEPIIFEAATSSDVLFEVYLYGPENLFPKYELLQKAQLIKNNLESKISGLSSIDIGSLDFNTPGGGSNSSTNYEIVVLLDSEKLEELGLSLGSVSRSIKAYNKNTPIGNHTIGDLSYDFRFDGELENEEELKNIVLKSNAGSKVLLKDISTIKKEYADDSIKKLGFKNASGYNYISLLFKKSDNANIFGVSARSKEQFEALLEKNINLKGLKSFYVKDMSELIKEDYVNLGQTALFTLILVFLIIFLFVGLKESLIASLLLPLSFFITFIFLNFIGYSLNFLTNFALVLTLGISIDTVIVIIEGASEKQKLGYNKKEAVLLAIKEFSSPLISGTFTTLSAFLPLIFLPGIMGKFLSYIPITVFTTLLGALVLSLTVSSALFITFAKDRKTYHRDEKLENTFTEEQKIFLEEQRAHKQEKSENKLTLREKILDTLSMKYYNFLKTHIEKKSFFLLVFFLPIVLLVLSFIFLAPKIGFSLFPATDESIMTLSIDAKPGTDKKYLEKYLKNVDEIVAKLPELKVYSSTLSGNSIDVYIELMTKQERKALGLKTIFKVEKQLKKEFQGLESYGLDVSFKLTRNGPPTGDPVGIELIANDVKSFETLQSVSKDFEEKFKKVGGTKNIHSSSTDSPGQFIFRFNKEKLSQLALTPNDILTEVYLYTNGLTAGSIKSVYEDNDIVLKIKKFEDSVKPEDIENLIINTKIGKIRVGDFITYSFENAVNSISRKDGKISVTVGGELQEGFTPSEIQSQFMDIVSTYNFPSGISYKTGGENAENADLIASTIMSLFIALFLIFSILVFQFNSFSQPSIVLFSVILALLGVNIGLFFTGNPYSMTFGIGFIALTGVVVNDAIILVDRTNKNLLQGIDLLHSVIGAAKSRLQPIIVTTLTTVFGVFPLALQDEFWAPLGFTIIFGLIAGSTMTLFSIPTLYYKFFGRRYEKNRK